MDNLWSIKAEIERLACEKRINHNYEIFKKVFTYLDADGNEKVG